MNKEHIAITVVVPAYNEEDNIEPLLQELSAVLNTLNKPYEILIVDDGSSDGTKDKLTAAKKKYPELRTIHFRRNHGQTAAIDAGLKKAYGNEIIVIDADLQSDPADIPLLLSHLKTYDAVCGWRVKRQDTFVKRISSRIANGFRNWATNETIQDTGSSIKAFKRECLSEIKLYNGLHRFLPTLIKLEGYRVGEVQVNHRPRLKGTSKYNIANRLFRGLYDLIAVRWMQKRQLRYQEDMYE